MSGFWGCIVHIFVNNTFFKVKFVHHAVHYLKEEENISVKLFLAIVRQQHRF
jgi:hypothetical protein